MKINSTVKTKINTICVLFVCFLIMGFAGCNENTTVTSNQNIDSGSDSDINSDTDSDSDSGINSDTDSDFTQLPEQLTIPGNGDLEIICDFEDSKYEGDNMFDYGAGWSGRGFGLSGSQRGAPENIFVDATPPNGILGSTKSLFFEHKLRFDSSFYSDNPEAVGTQMYGKEDREPQDDFFLYAGQYTPKNSLSMVVSYYVDLTGSARSSFGLRSTTYFTNGSREEAVYPAVWMFTHNGESSVFDDLNLYLRVPDFSADYNKSDFVFDLPDHSGWWTLGLSFSPDGDVHYFVSEGTDDLTIDDYLGSASIMSPGHAFVETKDAVVMISTNNDDEINTLQIMDDIKVYSNTKLFSSSTK